VKRILTAILIFVLACAFCGCAAEKPGAAEVWYSFTDSTGTEVTLSERPERVAVLFSSYAEIWTLAGGEVTVTVGESIERGFAPADTPLCDAGAGKTIDTELLLAAEPDLVIGSADITAQAEVCRAMADAGIPAALFRVDTFAEYLEMLRICTEITGNAAAYETYGLAVEREIEELMAEIKAADPAPREILFVRAASSAAATKAKRAPDNFVCTMLDELGAVNIADSAPMLLDGLSFEEVLLRDPDFIFLSTMGSAEAAESYIADLFSQEGWRDLTAVKNGSCTFLEKSLFHFKPNAAWAEAYKVLAGHLYPELELE